MSARQFMSVRWRRSLRCCFCSWASRRLTMWYRSSLKRMEMAMRWPALVATIVYRLCCLPSAFAAGARCLVSGSLGLPAILTLLEFWKGTQARMRRGESAVGTPSSNLTGPQPAALWRLLDSHRRVDHGLRHYWHGVVPAGNANPPAKRRITFPSAIMKWFSTGGTLPGSG